MQILYKKKLAKISTLLDDEKQGLQQAIQVHSEGEA